MATGVPAQCHVDLQKLKELRKRAGLSQAQVAAALGYKTALGYHYIETGRCRLRADQLFRLAQLYQVDSDHLIDDPATAQQHPTLNATGTD